MNLQAVKAATGSELAAGAMAAARNACDLLDEAEVLAKAGYWARACALAGLSIEEVGKVVSLGLLAGMPESLKAQAPVGRMLGWHQWKQAEGQVVAMVPYLPPRIAAGLLTMPEADLAKLISEYEVQAEEADRLKRSGLYVDIGPRARIREPAEITEADAARQLAQARRAVASAMFLCDPRQKVRLTYPHAERARLARAMVQALAAKVPARTPDDAAEVMLASVSRARSD